MTNLTITKEKVLEAASKCSTAKETLKVLFPEAFETEDKNAFVKEFEETRPTGLNSFCMEAFGKERVLEILRNEYPEDKPHLKGRAFWINSNYAVNIGDGKYGGTYIEITKK